MNMKLFIEDLINKPYLLVVFKLYFLNSDNVFNGS